MGGGRGEDETLKIYIYVVNCKAAAFDNRVPRKAAHWVIMCVCVCI